MKCPFCAEDDLKDEATVCKHCGRDIGVYQLFAARIAALEQRVSEWTERRSDQGADTVAPSVSPGPTPMSIGRLALTIVATGCGTALLFIFGVRPHESSIEQFFGSRFLGLSFYKIVAALVINSVPAMIGLWIGLRHRPQGWARIYLSVGMAFAIVLYLSLVTFWALKEEMELTVARFMPEDKDDVLIGVLSPVLSVLAGGLLARTIWQRRLGLSATGFVGRMAGRVVNLRGENSNSVQRQDHVQRLAAILSAVAPLLTFAASIVGAYLGFLAKK